ncbi:MAG: hypothetical protein ABI488_04085 [Polyangiaceae bacterium]
MAVFEACSADDPSTPNPFNNPPTLEISDISLGNGSIGQGGDSSVLACDDTIGVTFAVSNWDLYPPGKCGSTPQCGQLKVSLLDGPGGAVILTHGSGSVGVNLDLTALVKAGNFKAGSYAIQADLVDDSGAVYPITGGGNSTVERAFKLSLADGCMTGTPAAGAGGASGEGGMGGAPFIGEGGFAGSRDELGGAGGVVTP